MDDIEKFSNELTFLKEVDNIKAKVDDSRPFDKSLENKVLQKLRLDWNYNSNAIEGNSFTKGETIALLMEGMTAKGKPFKDALDIRGHNDAIDLMMSIIKNDRELNETDIRNLHKLLLVEDFYSPAITEEGLETKKLIKVGEYKSSPNHVATTTGEIHYYASVEETPVKMKELLTWYNETIKTENFHPIVLASVFHHRFVSIHPFDDGNGRMARLLTNLILLKYDYPIVVIKNDIKQEYFSRLSQADNGELIPFIEMISISVNDSLEIYLSAINGEEISDSADIDKQISLFMQELNLTQKRVLNRNPELMNKISLKLISLLKGKLDLFNPAFQTKQEVIRERKGGRWSIVVSNQLNNQAIFDKSVGSYIEKYNSASYLYSLLNDVKRNKGRVDTEIQIEFLNKTYIVSCLGEAITKYYGDKIIDAEVTGLINFIIEYNKTEIKKIFEE